MKIKFFVAVLILISGCIPLWASGVSGRLVTEENTPVAGANISIQGTVLGGASDSEGMFRITRVPAGEYRLLIHVIGFKTESIFFTVGQDEQKFLGEIVLSEILLESDPVVVTAGKFEQQARDVPVSISTVSPKEIENHNSLTIDQALQFVPGVNMNQDQVNIRGSSGYSRGAGSRVIMLVDGMPYITGDTQGIISEAMPVNNIERIEVVKGAGSALYGSSAIGGVINIITKPVSDVPQTNFSLYGGFHDDAYWKEWNWSDRSRYFNGQMLEHSRKAGGLGMRFGITRDEDDSYRRNDWHKRYKVSGRLEYNLTPYDRLTLSGHYMDQRRGSFLYWKNLDNALVPPDDQRDDRVHSKRGFSALAYRRVISESSFIKWNTTWFANQFEDNIDAGNHSASDYFNSELQYNFSWQDHLFVVGASAGYSVVASNIFGDRSGNNLSVFIQDQYSLNEKWLLSAGLRYDYFEIDKLETRQQISPKTGLVFKPGESTAVRMSAGTGFRAPSMAEAFTSTTAGGFLVEPNENLKPESSYSLEAGLNQILGPSAAADVALFYNRYRDMIEGGLTPAGKIQFANITNAEIKGIELDLNWWVLPGRILLHSAYTYIDPQNLTENDFLNYRPRHLFYNDLQWTHGRIQIGSSFRFISRYDRIDQNFALVIADAQERVAAKIVDVRIFYNFRLSRSKMRASFFLNNLFNYHYTDLIGAVAPVRNAVLRLDIGL